jgi:RHS repeat-associated protein
VTTTFTYDDGIGRLMGMRVEGLTGTSAIEWVLERDRMGRITKRSRTADGITETKTWTYDSAGRIVNEIYQPAPVRSPTPLVSTRVLDGDGVAREQTELAGAGTLGTLRQRGPLGRVTSIGGTSLQYDAAGNLRTDRRQQYQYDAWNRLVRVTAGGQTVATYEYDAFGRRNAATYGSEREEYLYDGWELVEISVGGVVRERYIYSDDLDDLLAVQIGDERYTVLQSPEGHVESLVDDQHRIVESYDYSLGGMVMVSDAARRPLGTPPRCRLTFQRRMWDHRVGLYDFRARWYDPWLGQFLSADPAGFSAGANLYALCNGDPVNFFDATGEQGATAGAGATARQQHDPVYPGYPWRRLIETLVSVFAPVTEPKWGQGFSHRSFCPSDKIIADPIYKLWSGRGKQVAKAAPGYFMSKTVEHRIIADRTRARGMAQHGYTPRARLWKKFRRAHECSLAHGSKPTSTRWCAR